MDPFTWLINEIEITRDGQCTNFVIFHPWLLSYADGMPPSRLQMIPVRDLLSQQI